MIKTAELPASILSSSKLDVNRKLQSCQTDKFY